MSSQVARCTTESTPMYSAVVLSRKLNRTLSSVRINAAARNDVMSLIGWEACIVVVIYSIRHDHLDNETAHMLLNAVAARVSTLFCVFVECPSTHSTSIRRTE